MGLCKCPKRKVTNQFCYEHRVNVCEHCMVTNHPKCIVQSYLQWLQDSDYEAVCEICSKDLNNEDCVRLTCYHVFHWGCLDSLARALPATTAPAGYTCPKCNTCLFPQPNLISPVADVLKEKLAGVNWARIGLGLPLLSEEREIRPLPEDVRSNSIATSVHQNNCSDAVVHVEDTITPFSRSENTGQVPRRVYQTVIDDKQPLIFDHDENKYKRKSATEWFSRWWKSVANSGSPTYKSGHFYRRYFMAAVIMFILLGGLIVVFSKLGRMATDDDPSFLPESNPNIRISNN
ncbi:zinc finger protein-like 1 homolog [Lycorma delicatula]|uniref:zinc finger protein-like 1 homolog n=1 Tax=Lycorma delicatula TaxID=130591 RepID=UPI003F50FFAD